MTILQLQIERHWSLFGILQFPLKKKKQIIYFNMYVSFIPLPYIWVNL